MICLADNVNLETLYYLRDNVPSPPPVVLYDCELGLLDGFLFVTSLDALIHAVEERLEKQKLYLEACYGT